MNIRGVIMDLDGTVYCGTRAVPGAAEFIRQLGARGLKYLFVTNRANRAPAEIQAHLGGIGIQCNENDVFTSGQATARFIGRSNVYCIGEKGLRLALETEGHRVTEEHVNCVVVSYDRSFNYEKLRIAASLVRNGARFVATNPDNSIPTEDGIVPEAGAIMAAVEAASGLKAEIVGKPGKLIFEIAMKQMGLSKDEVVAVGDNIATDVAAGRAAGVRTALMLTGITSRKEAELSPVCPTWMLPDYDALSSVVFG